MMSGVVFVHTLRRNWRAMLYWGLGLGLYGFFVVTLLQDENSLKQIVEIVETLPPAMLQAFGISSDMTFLATPGGFLSARFFGLAIILLLVYAVSAGLNVTANEEDQGILDVLLSAPLPRWRLIIEKMAAYAVLITGIVLICLAALLAGISSSPLEFQTGRVIESTINMIPIALLVMAGTTCITAFIHRKGRSTTLAAVLVAGSYFLNVIGSAAGDSIAGTINRLSIFFYYDNNSVMQQGLVIANVMGLLAVAALFIVASIWAFQRRDVGI